MLKKLDEYLTNKIKSIINEQKPQEEPVYSEKFLLPEPDRNQLLACSIQRTHADLVPVGVEGSAMDEAITSGKDLQGAYGIRGAVNDIIYTHYATQCFIGFQACAILTQNWLINKACTLPPAEAIETDYELSYKTVDNDELDKDFLTEIKELSDDEKKFNIKKKAQIYAEKKRQFGQILAFPVVEGVDYELPFNLDAVGEGSYKGMTIVDPVWVMPELDSEATNDPTSLRFYKPTYFQLPNGKRVHYSWTLWATNGEVPDILKPTYYFGGYPIPQLIFERAYAAEKVANEAPMLAMSKRLLVVDANLNTYVLNQQKAETDLKAISHFRDNWGVMIKRPGESVNQIDTSLTDFDEVMMSQFQITAAAAGMTAVKLLETQPKGFNSTGEYEEDQNRKLLKTIQNNDFKPFMLFHYKLLAKSKYNKELDFGLTFDEIDTPTEKERAEINEIKSRTDSNYINAGVLSPDECRDSLVKDINSGYNNLTGEAPVDDFGEFGQEGGNEESISPFSLDEWNENDHPRKDNGQFGEGSSGGIEKFSKRDKIRKRTVKEVQLPKEEYAKVMHEVNTNLSAEQRKKKQITKFIGNYKYIIQNNGFNDYKIVDKKEI